MSTKCLDLIIAQQIQSVTGCRSAIDSISKIGIYRRFDPASQGFPLFRRRHVELSNRKLIICVALAQKQPSYIIGAHSNRFSNRGKWLSAP